MEKIVILGGLAIISGVSLLLMKNEKEEPKKKSPTPKKSPTKKRQTPEDSPVPSIRKTIKKSVREESKSPKEKTAVAKEKTAIAKEKTAIAKEKTAPKEKTTRTEIPTVVRKPIQETTRRKDTESSQIQLRRAPSRSPTRSSSPKRSILKRASTSPRRVYSPTPTPTPSPTPSPLNIPRGVLSRSVSDSATINSDRGADPFFTEETRPLTDKEWEEANVLTPPTSPRSRRRSKSR
jgi:FtsZ-interacting cell division protein ZipA